MSGFIARQPIFDQSMNVYGYELLYRSGLQVNAFDGTVNADTASTETIINSFHGIGIEKLTNKKHAFINFTEKLLLSGVATLFPKDELVIELLEDIVPSERVLFACQALRDKGYMLALDDFIIQESQLPLLDIANIIKIDFLSTPLDVIYQFVQSVKDRPIKLLAEKVENNKVYQIANAMGFSYFQGYFFSKPVTMNDKQVDPLVMNRLRIIRLIMQPNYDFWGLSNIIKQDVAFSYRLLRLVNSSFFGFSTTVKSLRQALAILGVEEIKKWVTLVSMMDIRKGGPDELIRMSLIRGRFMELIAPHVKMARQVEELYLTGLLSLIDAILEQPKEDIFQQINLADTITRPLLTGEGRAAEILKIILFYEQGEFQEAVKLGIQCGISGEQLQNLYLEALEWVNMLEI